MERLPAELNTKILIRVPAKTLGQLRCVSKAFNTFLKSHHFIKLHSLQQTSSSAAADGQKVIVIAAKPSFHTLTISNQRRKSRPLALPIPSNLDFRRRTCLVGSCMGLVCLRCPPHIFFLLNPTTREFRVLPYPGKFWITSMTPLRLTGFGYVPSLDDFMVVSVCIYKENASGPVFKLYSAKANKWRTKRVRVHGVPPSSLTCDFSVCVNGVTYWLGWSVSVEIDGKLIKNHKIMGFDFVKGKFSIILLHEAMVQSEIKSFAVLDGCLAVLVRDADLSLGMWVMKELGVVESWTKIFSFKRSFIKASVSILPICNAGNKVLFEINRQLVWYDPEKNLTTTILRYGLQAIKSRDGMLDMARYEESLVSPYAYMREDKEDKKKEETSLKLSDAGAHEKAEQRMKELEDEVRRLRIQNEELLRSTDEAITLETRLHQGKDDAPKEVADLKEKLARGEEEFVQKSEVGDKTCYDRLAAAGIDANGGDLGPKNGEQDAQDESA